MSSRFSIKVDRGKTYHARQILKVVADHLVDAKNIDASVSNGLSALAGLA